MPVVVWCAAWGRGKEDKVVVGAIQTKRTHPRIQTTRRQARRPAHAFVTTFGSYNDDLAYPVQRDIQGAAGEDLDLKGPL